jgi:hypothetical protein
VGEPRQGRLDLRELRGLDLHRFPFLWCLESRDDIIKSLIERLDLGPPVGSQLLVQEV